MKPSPAKSCPSCGERYDAGVLYCPRDGTPLASSRKSPAFGAAEGDPYVGITLGGQIQVRHLIGIGSMGRVYRAFQAGIERDVAVKILHRELSTNAELVSRFHREAKIASRLVHPNVVQVLMTGSVPATADPRIGGELYLVMEHLDGISLLSALAAAGAGGESEALPLPRALHIILQVCDAVGEAHAQGIVHRDLKPENIMLVRRGEDPDYVKVLDFGIARLDWADKAMTTQAGLIFGTAKYISPEGAEGQRVGPPADVYSIATMLYQCLAGRAPFEGDSPVALLVQHTHAPPTDLRSIARSSYVPAPIAQVVMQNLAKKPSERAPDARALGRDLALAVRASGLDPDEIAAQPGLLRASAVMKLASKSRTKSLDLSPALAAQIGGMPAPTLESAHIGDLGPLPPHAEVDRYGNLTARRPEEERASSGGAERAWSPRSSGAERSSSPSDPHHAAFGSGERAAFGSGEHAAFGSGEHAAFGSGERVSGGGAERSSSPRSSSVERSALGGVERSSFGGAAPGSAAAPFSGAGPGGAAPSWTTPFPGDPARTAIGLGIEPARDSAPAPSTMQGVASAARPLPRRAVIARAAALLACAGAVGIVVFLGGRHLGAFGGPGARDSLEAHIERARDCMGRHAWDAPPGENVKDIIAQALARWPRDPRLADLRRESSERIVTDALGRKYAGDRAGAIRLAKLAVELHPELTTAQHLVLELSSGPPGAAPEPPPQVSPESSAPPDAAPDRASPRGPAPPEVRGATAGPPPTAGQPPAPTPRGATPAPRGAPATPAPRGAAAPPTPAPTRAGAPPAGAAPPGNDAAPPASAAAPAPALPPSPPPLPAEPLSPLPSSTGPWL
ncbi:protein kinase domain-containing protein [Sorangium sp. So ce1335]|uniref:serine/threonine-protein kinase n=1 Tax=Sorangium sp. So ce1335 TaxID=3133335 RepID=UPI003F639110